MEEMAVILDYVAFVVEVELENDSVIGLAQIVDCKKWPDDVCYACS